MLGKEVIGDGVARVSQCHSHYVVPVRHLCGLHKLHTFSWTRPRISLVYPSNRAVGSTALRQPWGNNEHGSAMSCSFCFWLQV